MLLLVCYLTSEAPVESGGGDPLGEEFEEAIAFDRVRSGLVVLIG